MPDGATRPVASRDPDWPLLMDAGAAARYLSARRSEFRALLLAGLVPPPRELLPGVTRWHREDLDRCMARLFNLRREAEADAAQQQEDLRRKLADFRPAVRGAKDRRRD